MNYRVGSIIHVMMMILYMNLIDGYMLLYLCTIICFYCPIFLLFYSVCLFVFILRLFSYFLLYNLNMEFSPLFYYLFILDIKVQFSENKICLQISTFKKLQHFYLIIKIGKLIQMIPQTKPTNSSSIQIKKRKANIVVKMLFKALMVDMYPAQQVEAIFGIKMEDTNKNGVESMPTGAIVYNVWAGLFKNQMLSEKSLQEALLQGNLPQYFQKLVHKLMQQARKLQVFPGLYMPELIKRGFGVIKWDKDFHTQVKLN